MKAVKNKVISLTLNDFNSTTIKGRVNKVQSLFAAQGLEYKYTQGDPTRKTGTIAALFDLALRKPQNFPISGDDINENCFNLFSFTMSHNKTSGKSKSNSIKRRLKNYLLDVNTLFTYDANINFVHMHDKAKALFTKRKPVTKKVKKAIDKKADKPAKADKPVKDDKANKPVKDDKANKPVK